jgi:uncharacterized protein YbjT (DUF2867 family)
VLEAGSHDVVPIARSAGVDVVTGEGLAEALAGVESVIDAATSASSEQQAATEFFIAAARNLQQLGERAGVQRIVVVSIIGTNRFSAGYGAAKQAHERAMLSGPIPARILRAAQFHEFVAQLLDWGKQDGVSYVPKMRTQLVAARTVAEALADLATGPESPPAPESNPAPIPEIAGPREESLVEMATLLAARRGEKDQRGGPCVTRLGGRIIGGGASAREKVGVASPTVTRLPAPQSDLPEAKDMPTSMLRHYRVRLRRSRRLPYRIARLLLLALLVALLLIVYVAER